MKLLIKSLLLSLFILTVTLGCSSGRRTVESTETTTTYPDTYNNQDSVQVQRTTEVTEEKESSDGCGGVLSCIVDGVGEIIALPFRLVGGLFRAIF